MADIRKRGIIMGRLIELAIITEVPDDVGSDISAINNWVNYAYPDIEDEELLKQYLIGWKFSDNV